MDQYEEGAYNFQYISTHVVNKATACKHDIKL